MVAARLTARLGFRAGLPLMLCALVAAAFQDGRRTGGSIEFKRVGRGGEQYLHPDLAVPADGAVWVGAIASGGERDRLVAFEVRQHAKSKVIEIGGEGEPLGPRLASDADGGLLAVWPELRGGEVDLWARALDGDGWGELERVTDAPGSDATPAVVHAGDRWWVVWTSFREGRLDVRARVRGPDGWEPEIRVSDHPASDVQPSVGVAPDGGVWAAWSSWRHGTYATGNYEILARRLDIDSSTVRVSNAEGPDLHPELTATPGSLALVWTSSVHQVVSVKGLSANAYDAWYERRHAVSWLDGSSWSAPLEVPVGNRTLLDRVRAVPGREPHEVWLLYHEAHPSQGGARNPRYSKLRRVSPSGASAPEDVSGQRRGASQRMGAGWSGDRLWSVEAVEGDRNERGWLRVFGIEAQDFPRRKETDLVAARERAALPVPDLSLRPDPRPEAEGPEGSRWSAFFGNLHVHTDESVDGRAADGRPEQNLQALHDVARLDFAALTDHCGWRVPVSWTDQWKLVESWNRPGHFVTLHGFEWSSTQVGHKNVLFADAQTARSVGLPEMVTTAEVLYGHIEGADALAIPHHPSHGSPNPTDWTLVRDDLQRLVEIFQKRGSYEHDGAALARRTVGRWEWVEGHSVRDALDAGHHLGFIASPDHGGGLGLAGVWATELTREAVYEALHARRTFGTTGPQMALYFEVAGRPQGSQGLRLGAGEPVAMRGVVHGVVPGLRLTLVSDTGQLAESESDGARAEISWTGALEPAGEHYVYLRAARSDGHVGWSSPVWLEVGP